MLFTLYEFGKSKPYSVEYRNIRVRKTNENTSTTFM